MKSTTKKLSNQYTAIILAAGQGRRLRPLTNKTPKCLVKVCGRPILHWQLSALSQNKIKNVAIVVGFMDDLVIKYTLNNFPGLNLKFIRNQEYATTNTLYSLALATEADSGKHGILQLNGDVVFDPKIISMLLKTDYKKNYLAAQYKKCGEEEIKICLADDGSVTALNKNIPPEKVIGEAIGINKFSTAFWKNLSKNLISMKNNFPNEYFEYAIEQTLPGKNKLLPHDIGSLPAIEIDFEKDLKLAKKLFVSMV